MTRYILALLQLMSTYDKICVIHPITLVTTYCCTYTYIIVYQVLVIGGNEARPQYLQ